MLHFLKRGRSFYKNLAALALPLVLQNLINSSLALVDTAMVGMLGQNELAGVSLSNTPFLSQCCLYLEYSPAVQF